MSNEPRKTRGIHRDYCQLHDPFLDDDNKAAMSLAAMGPNPATFDDECHTLKETKTSPEWPK
jgi:hypothetical protein